MRKFPILILLLTLLSISCSDSDQLLVIDDIVGTWVCNDTNRSDCEDPNDDGPYSCDGQSLIFNSNNTCTLISIDVEFEGTFTFENNILVLTLDLSDVPSGIEDETLGFVEFDPIDISIDGDRMTYRQTTKDLDNCFSTSIFLRSN